MLLVIQIAGGILLAGLVLATLWWGYKGIRWAIVRYQTWKAEEEFVNRLAAEIKLDREGDAE